MSTVKDLGVVTAYAYAVAGGYVGTEAQFETLLGNIAGDLEQIENLTVTVTTLSPGSSATASYSNGVLALCIPQGEKGETGATGQTGATGATGNGIASIEKTGTSGNVDTYTITYTNGQATTFTVTNGNVTSVAGKTGAVTLTAGDSSYSSSTTYAAGTVGAELTAQKSALTALDDHVDYLATFANTSLESIATQQYYFTLSNGVVTRNSSSAWRSTGFLPAASVTHVKTYVDNVAKPIIVYFGSQDYTDVVGAIYPSSVVEQDVDVTPPSGAKWCAVQCLASRISYATYGYYLSSVTLNSDLVTKEYTDEISTYKVSANLYDPTSQITSGFISPSNGNISSNTSYLTTDYIPVVGGKNAVFSDSSGQHVSCRFIAVYNASREIIAPSDASASGNGTQQNSAYLSLSSSAAYVRVSVASNQVMQAFMVSCSDSTTAPTFEKYYAPHYTANSSFVQDYVRERVDIYAADGIDKFYEKMLYAFSRGNCEVYIHKGTYTYTNAFVEGIRAENHRGVPIGGDNKYYFETGAYLVCEYTGDSASDVVNLFSPLDSWSIASSYEIYNLTLTAKNVCYALHDEANGQTTHCKHVYKNCYIELDNTSLVSGSGNYISKALGGGLGAYEEVIIEDCVFKTTNPAQAEMVDATYHGANGQNFTDAKIVVTGCWFSQNFHVACSNLTGVIPRVICSNNSSGAGQPGFSGVESVAWNNVVRTS